MLCRQNFRFKNVAIKMRYPKISVQYLILLIFFLLFLKYILNLTQSQTNLILVNTKFIFYDSSQYKYYTKEYVLEETKKFVSRQTKEDDPVLIEFIKKIIKPPSAKPYNLSRSIKNGDYSQEGQSLYIDKILNGRTEGFFIGNFKNILLNSKQTCKF